MASVAVSQDAVLLNRIYAHRPCFICQKRYWCEHREPQVDRAEAAGGASYEMKIYTFTSAAFAREDGEPVQVSVETDDSGIVRFADPLVRRFLGEHVNELCAWFKKYGPTPVEINDAAPRLF